MSNAIISTRLRRRSGRSKAKNQPVRDWDQFGRTGRTQVLHIELTYKDGSKGVINVTSPHIIWGEDVETQWIHMRTYIKSQADRLGIIRYHAHCATAREDGSLNIAFSWSPFDLITNQEIRS